MKSNMYKCNKFIKVTQIFFQNLAFNSSSIELHKIQSCIFNKNRSYCFNSQCCQIANPPSQITFNITELNSKILSDIISVSENDGKVSNILKDVSDAQFKGRFCPEHLNLTQLSELAACATRSQRLKYLKYLYKKEKVKMKDEQKKEERKMEKMNVSKNVKLGCDFSQYGLQNNTLFLSFRRKSFNILYDKRLAKSALFGNKIVIDLSYDDFMVEKEKKSCAAQLRILYSVNRANISPFDLHFCNAKPSFKCVQYFKRDIKNVENTLLSIFEGSYTDIFPKENLVYLSPHAEETLKEFDHNAIYIIGGFVDIVKRDKISLEKAAIDGIKSYSLPLCDHVQWKTGSKSLTINQVFEIMLILKNTKDWKKAFECIPSRKIKEVVENEQETQPPFKTQI